MCRGSSSWRRPAARCQPYGSPHHEKRGARRRFAQRGVGSHRGLGLRGRLLFLRPLLGGPRGRLPAQRGAISWLEAAARALLQALAACWRRSPRCLARSRSAPNDVVQYSVGTPSDPWEDHDIDGRFYPGIRGRCRRAPCRLGHGGGRRRERQRAGERVGVGVLVLRTAAVSRRRQGAVPQSTGAADRPLRQGAVSHAAGLVRSVRALGPRRAADRSLRIGQRLCSTCASVQGYLRETQQRGPQDTELSLLRHHSSGPASQSGSGPSPPVIGSHEVDLTSELVRAGRRTRSGPLVLRRARRGKASARSDIRRIRGGRLHEARPTPFYCRADGMVGRSCGRLPFSIRGPHRRASVGSGKCDHHGSRAMRAGCHEGCAGRDGRRRRRGSGRGLGAPWRP